MPRILYNQYREATNKRDKLKLIIFGEFNPSDFNFAEVYPFNGEYFPDKYFDAILVFGYSIPPEAVELSRIYHAKIFDLTGTKTSVKINDIKAAKFLKLGVR